MQFSPLIKELIDAFKILPGVGPKSAQRMAFHLLERNRQGALQLSHVLHNAMEHVKHCEQCRTFCENKLCEICANPKRQENQKLCVVESPQDMLAIEQTSEFKGCYFVLMGHLSPIDGIGPADIGLEQLSQIFENDHISEVIGGELEFIDGNTLTHAFTGRRDL